MSEDAARQVVAAVRSGGAGAQEALGRFLASPSFWAAAPALWALDPHVCAVAAARRTRWRADEEAARAVAALAARPSPSAAVARQLGLARARLLLAGLPAGPPDEPLLEALPPLGPLPAALVAACAARAWALCCQRPDSAVAAGWLPLLLRLRPALDLAPLGAGAALGEVLGREVTPASHPELFARLARLPLAAPLFAAAWEAAGPALRPAFVPRLCSLLAGGCAAALPAVPGLLGPPAALAAALAAVLRGAASAGLAEAAEKKELRRALAHLWTALGAAGYGAALLEPLRARGPLAPAERRAVWLAARSVEAPALLAALLPHALREGETPEAARLVGRAAAALAEVEEGLALRCGEWLLARATPASARALGRLCAAAPARLAPLLPRLAACHRAVPRWGSALAALALPGAPAVWAEAVEAAAAAGDGRALLQLAEGPAAGAAEQWAGRWGRVAAAFGRQTVFWTLAGRLLAAQGPRFAPLAAGTLEALRACPRGPLPEALLVFGLLVQQFHEERFWHGTLEAACSLATAAGAERDAELLTGFFNVMLQPLFYAPETVLGRPAVLRGLLQLALAAAELPDPELHRALAQVSRAGFPFDSNPSVRAAGGGAAAGGAAARGGPPGRPPRAPAARRLGRPRAPPAASGRQPRPPPGPPARLLRR